MKKPYMCTFIGFSEGDWVLIILYWLYGSKAGRRTNPILA